METKVTDLAGTRLRAQIRNVEQNPFWERARVLNPEFMTWLAAYGAAEAEALAAQAHLDESGFSKAMVDEWIKQRTMLAIHLEMLGNAVASLQAALEMIKRRQGR
jgi:hypothetical protein